MTTPRRIQRLLSESCRRPDGLVPVIGSGLNIQASMIDGRDLAQDWAGLLDGIAIDIGLTERERKELPHSFLARWERLLTGWAQANAVEPFKAESQLQMRVVRGLRSLEETASEYTLYREFAEAHLSDLISLNFDRRIALALDSEKFEVGPKVPREGPSAQTLYRHSRVIVDSNTATRVWYPHGDTKRADTLKLGVRRYGFHLGLLHEYLGFEDEQWRSNKPWIEDVVTYDEPHTADKDDDHEKTSWVDVFLDRPLVFIGCGLGSDEWSLWWLLSERSKYSDSPPAYYTHVGPCDSVVASIGPAVGLRPIAYQSYQQLWGTIREALA